MRIWLINHYAVPPQYYPLARPTNFAKNLMQLGHEVIVFAASTVHNSSPMKNLIEDDTPWREETVDGVHYVFIKGRNYEGNGLQRIYNMCEFAWKLPGVCKHFEKPDAIVATSVPPMSCAMGIHLARKYGCKGVAEIADLWPETLVVYGAAGKNNPAIIALRCLEKWIYKKAGAVVFTMEGAYDYIVEQGWEKEIPREKVHFINNGVDLRQFDYNRENFHVEDEDLSDPELFKVVYTGSIRRVNNLGQILDAAKCITDPKIKILLWGAGDEVDALKRRVEEEHISNVVLKGVVEKKYIPSIVSRADLNVVHWEMSPLLRFGVSYNKLFDYMAAGKPIFSTVRPGHSLMVRYDCGIDTEGFTPQDFADGIQKIAALERERLEEMGRNARRGAEDYDFKVLTEKLINVIEGA